MAETPFSVITITFLFQCFLFTRAAEQLIGSALINRTFTFEDAKRVFIDVEHRLPNGGQLRGFSMYIRPLPNFQRDHYARFCIWTRLSNRDKTTFKLKYQTAARFPKREGIFTARIDDDVFTTDLDYFGVTFEQETGTITREVNAQGKLMFSAVYDNLPNTNDEIVIIQENYLNRMSMQAIIDDGASVACSSGFVKDSSGNCININECLNNNGGCDQNCNDNDGSFTCSCRSGFSLRSNGRTCENINECLNNNGGCDHNCNDNDGSFTCSCRNGFSLQSNGRTCQSNDQCSNSGCVHRCVNTGNSYYCECFNGYTLDSDGRRCNNINECLNNNGGCDQNCNDNDGSFTCSCRNGFSLQSNGRSCQENQAQYITGPAGMTGATGQRGPEGQRGPPGPPGNVGSDTDECPTAGCQHSCVNTFGSFYCQCNTGYSLNGNGRNCDNINECSSNNGLCDQNCNDNDGSYRCSCRSGYRLSPNNHNCIDIDECEEKKPCGTETCVNTIGGYRCVELRFLNDVSGYQDDFRYAKGSINVTFSKQSEVKSDNIIEENELITSTDFRVVAWLGALSVLMALLVGANVIFCRKRSNEERPLLIESTSDHSVTSIELNDIEETRLQN